MSIKMGLQSYCFTKSKKPIDIESGQSGVWGEVHDYIIDDAVTRGRYALETGGAVYALNHYGVELQWIIDQGTWRAPDAFNLLARIRREALAPGVFTPQTPSPGHVSEVDYAVV